LRYTPDFPFGAHDCGNSGMIFTVTMVVNTSFGEFTSAPSQWFMTSCPHTMGDSVQIEVNFEQMDIANMDEPANKVYGQFAALPNGQPATHLLIGWWNGEAPVDDFGGVSGYISSLDNGNYALSGLELCRVSGGVQCPFTPEGNFVTDNNKLVVTIRAGDALQLFSELYDHNEYSNDDHICDGNAWVGPRTLQEWAATVNESVWLVQPGGHATCNLEVILNAISTGQR
jgi:hypothetical protein